MKKIFVIPCAILVFMVMGAVHAEIPFTQALGVYRGTKDEYKEISPFWGIVASQGMLEQIRFFGPYDKDEKGKDKGRDTIAKLLQKLFPCPDGVNFVANTRNKNPVGNLSRNLEEINSILEVLLSERESAAKQEDIITILNGLSSQSKLKNKNKKFAELLVDAYDTQAELANPECISQQLYPKNIVAISLLGFFAKVADSKGDFKKLALLMNDVDDQIFTKQDYEDNLENRPAIIENSDNDPELAFLMSRWYEAYEQPFMKPVSYRTDTLFDGRAFPDCGETSLRNVFMMLLGTKGTINPTALTMLQEKMVPLEGSEQNSLFQKLLTFFENNSRLENAATLDAHNAWAKVVSRLNQDQDFSRNSVQYGRGGEHNHPETFTYEIKSDFSGIGTKGLINMLNVIAKLIPDQGLNELWSEDKEERFSQAANKLTRFCKLLSRSDYKICWENKETQEDTITTSFPTLTFLINNKKAYDWQFTQGHFQLNPYRTINTDWRLEYSNSQFPNEWLGYFYTRINKEQMISDDGYGTHLPLGYIYNPDLRSLDGALETISFALYQTTIHQRFDHFIPLIARWIDLCVPLDDRYPVRQLASLLYGPSQDTNVGGYIREFLSHPQYEAVAKVLSQWNSMDYNTVVEEMFREEALSTAIILAAKQMGREAEISIEPTINTGTVAFIDKIHNLVNLTSLQLHVNDGITDTVVQHFTNLTYLGLSYNTKITDTGVQYLTNLLSLDLSYNTKITDAGVQYLINLTSLDLRRNNRITNSGMVPLINLRFLYLGDNKAITDPGVQHLTGLTFLDLGNNDTITDLVVQHLTNLTSLKLGNNNKITDLVVQNLTNLTSLNLWSNNKITDLGIQLLTTLTSLDLSDNEKITNTGVWSLINLKFLDLSNNNKITDLGVQRLTNLTSLNLSRNNKITDVAVQHLINLTSLNLSKNETITDEVLEYLSNLLSLDLSDTDDSLSYVE